MHSLFEVADVANHIARTGSTGVQEVRDLHAVRVGLALTGLATGIGAGQKRLTAEWQRLAAADADGNLQVLLDGHGVPGGFAILAFVDQKTNAEFIVDPERCTTIGRLPHGPFAWLRELSGGAGHEVAIARHLRDGILRHREAVRVIRRRTDGSTSVRRFAIGRPGIGKPRATPIPQGRFNEFRQTSGRAGRFYHYARLLALEDRPISLASAHDSFSHADAMHHYLFDRAADPRAYISWKLVEEEEGEGSDTNRIPSAQANGRAGGHWPLVTERLGDTQTVTDLVAHLKRRFAPYRIDATPSVCLAR